MPRYLRTGLLAVVLICVVMFSAPFSGAQRLAYFFDQRPELTILFIGNSRTSWNDMPAMVQSIADSAAHAYKLRVELYAPGGVGLTGHVKDPRVHSLLAQNWDHVVLQAQSSELIDQPNWGKWLPPAMNLIAETKENDASPAMFVTWRYTEECPEDPSWNASASAAMHVAIQQQHTWLAEEADVGLVNVGLVWEKVVQQQPDFSLYADCNHPSVHGSYLSALMFFGHMLKGDVAAVTYMPSEVSQHQADILKQAVLDFLTSSPPGGKKLPHANASAVSLDEPGRPTTIAARCMWGLFAQAQAISEHCKVGASPLRNAIDEALPQIEAHLIAAGELDTEASGYYRRMYEEDPDRAAQMCQSIADMQAHITEGYVEQVTEQILAAGPAEFSDDCI